MKFINVCFLMLFFVFANGQEVWEYYGDGGNGLSDLANDVEELPDGFIIIGNLNCPDSNFVDLCDVFLLKLDFEGNELWRKNYDFEATSAESIEITPDGGYLIGMTHKKESGWGLIDAEIVVMKTDVNGEIEWTKTIDNGAHEYKISDLKVTPDVGGFILIGSASETPSEYVDSYFDVYVYKGNDLGEMEWEYFYGGDETFELGIGIDVLDGGDFIIGATAYVYTPGTPHSDFLILRLSADGEEVWVNTFTGNDYEKVTSIVQAQDGNILVGGAWSDNSGGGFRIMKLNADTGEPIWLNNLFGDWGNLSLGYIALTDDGGFVIGFWYTLYVFKLDADGNVEWSVYSQKPKFYERINQTKVTTDGGILAVGEFQNNGLIGNRDIYVIKMNSMGGLSGTENIERDKQNKISIELYPNPTDAFLVVHSEVKPAKNRMLLIHDASGNELLQMPYVDSNTIVDVKKIPSGHYFLSLLSDGMVTEVVGFQKI